MAFHWQTLIKPLLVIPLSHNHNPEKHKAEKNAVSMRQKLSRILQIDQTAQSENHGSSEAPNSEIMIPKVVVRPNPFFTSITLDVTCVQGKHVIVRMFDEDDKIVKMFSWFLVKGINITNISEVEFLPTGVYSLDIVDLEGDVLYSTHISKG